MEDALFIHRIHFGFTATFHYLFPQITMGLAPLIVILKTLAMRTTNDAAKSDAYNRSARFWAKMFGLSFVMGVLTGIPMEFQFGTNWSHFSRLTGGVIGQPLVMEGFFSFFLESAFLGLFLFGERRLSQWQHWRAAFMVFAGSWLSGYFIITANAWMQHPVGFARLADRSFLRATCMASTWPSTSRQQRRRWKDCGRRRRVRPSSSWDSRTWSTSVLI